MLRANAGLDEDALRIELGRPAFEAWSADIGFVLSEIHFAIREVRGWGASRRVRTPVLLMPSRSSIEFQPLGVVGVIGPWNYPIQLSLGPVVGAIAAGNAVVIKPSEAVPRSAAVIRTIVERVDDPFVRIITGGSDHVRAMIDQRPDHILFTGGTQGAKAVLRAAAEHLIPVTLELGGACRSW